MQVDVNGTRLWFDVDGPALVPDGDTMRQRPTVVLVHGGPGSYDHSYFKPHFSRLTDVAQVVYLDLRDHGRSARHDPADWSYELCADDLRAFCEAIGLTRPIVFGHSMGGWVVLLYGARYPGHADGLIVHGTMARFDLDRLTDGFRRAGGDAIAAVAEVAFRTADVTEEEWAPVFAVYGPNVPDADQMARRVQNPDVVDVGRVQMRRLDVLDQLPQITSRTLVCVGDLDPVAPVAASEEILANLSAGVGRLEVIEGAGHFSWLDVPDRYWPLITDFITSPSNHLSPIR